MTADELWANFERSRFATMTPLMVEQPFTLYIGEGLSVEGRIDAVFEREDGVLEVSTTRQARAIPTRSSSPSMHWRSRRSGGNRRHLRGCYAHGNRTSAPLSMVWSRSSADPPPL